MTELWAIFTSLICCAGVYVAAQRIAMRFPAHERFKDSRTPPLAGDVAAALVGLQLGCLFLTVTARPVMSALLATALIILLLVLNRVKEHVLHEPLVLADAWLLPQIWKYPEMYFPFIPVKSILCGIILLVALLALLLWAEPGIPRSAHRLAYAVLASGAIAPALLIYLLRKAALPEGIGSALLRLLPVSHDAAADAARNGPLAAVLMHPVLAGQWERKKPDFMRDPYTRPAASRWPEKFEEMLRQVEARPLDQCPHVVLIQAESFCDIREHLPPEQAEALKDFLPNYDKLKAAGQVLPTPENAYGAYTMRTEFSKLTGLEMDQLGPFAFNPYLLAGRQPMWSLARYFKQKGYDTLCVHPYHKGFFRRDKVMPNLGFDRFLGLEELNDLERFGPYVSDIALGKRIIEEIEKADRPVFCFAITMEAHGPWLEGRLNRSQILQSVKLITNSCETTFLLYLSHLYNFNILLQSFSKLQNYFLICYGDHSPTSILT